MWFQLSSTLYDILREYQKEAVEIFLQRKKGIIVLPTGTGKTYVAISALQRLKNEGLVDTYIVTVPTISLALQWERVLRESGIPAKAYVSAKRAVSKTAATIFPYPTFIKLAKTKAKQTELIPTKTFLIIDEAHHAHKGTKLYDAVLNFNAEYIMGLTATVSKKETYPLPIIFQKTYGELRKFIPEVELYEVDVEPSAEFMQVYRALTNAIKNAVKKLDNPNLSEKEIRHYYNVYTRSIGKRHTLVATNNDIINKTVMITGLLEGKTLVFTLRIEAIKRLRTGIEKFGKKVIPILSATDIRKLSTTPWDVIIAAKRLGEGVDLPEVDNIVLSSYPAQLRTIIQEVGRGMRGGKGKTLSIFALVIKDTYMVNAVNKLAEFLGIKIPSKIEI